MGDIIGGLFGKEGKSKQSSTSTSSSSNLAYPAISQAFSPALNYTTAGGNMLGALLGIPGYGGGGGTGGGAPAPSPSTPVPGPTAPASTYTGSPLSSIMSMGKHTGQGAINSYMNYYLSHPDQDPGFSDISMFHGDPFKDEDMASNVLRARQQYLQSHPQGTAPAGGGAPATPMPTGAQAGSALENFANSAGMQFQRDQGMKAINANQSAKGLLQSGATGTALNKFGQGLAQTYLNQYLQNLKDFAGIGTQAGGVMTGAGQISNSTGESSGKSNAGKHGLIPDVLVAMASAGGGGGGGG